MPEMQRHQMLRILITDGDNRSSLALTRSLGRKGHQLYVTANHSKSLASSSRFCSQGGLPVPDPLLYGKAYIDEIAKLVKQNSIDVIFPMTEHSIYLLNTVRDSLSAQAILACPTQPIMQAVSDKSALFKLAENLQVPIPKTIHLSGIDDLPHAIAQIDNYPVVIKPALSRLFVNGRCYPGGVRYADSLPKLEQLYASNPVLRFPSIIQEKIIGPGTGLFTLYEKNRHLALFSHKRLSEKPPAGGVSVVSKSVPLDEEMVLSADRLLSAVGFSGVAMVEFKRDLKDGKAKLMEINGRFWGSLQLAIACGIDFPALYLDYLHGKCPLSPKIDYLAGHKLKWFWGTLDHLIIRLRNSSMSLNLPDDAPSKWRVICDFLKIREDNASFDVFNSRDLEPFLYESVSYFKAIGKRA